MTSEQSPDDTFAARSVVVSGLPLETRKETVIIHFQKRKHGGGEIDSVELVSEETAVVTFDEIEGKRDEAVVGSGKHSISQALKTFIQGGILKSKVMEICGDRSRQL